MKYFYRYTYLIIPCARNASKFLYTSANLDVFVCAVQIFQTSWNVRCHSPQRFSAHYHTRATHAKVLVEFQRQQAKLLRIATTGLTYAKYGFSFIE